MGEFVDIAALNDEGRFAAYVAQPAGTARAAIIVLQEIFGVNAGIRQKVEDWASEGYLTLAPDLFWRFRPRFDVDPDVPEELQEAFAVRSQFDADAGVRDVEACLRWARHVLGGEAKVGVIGFCLGGRIAYLAATRTDVDASIGYYGAGIDQKLGEARAIARPLLLHFAEADHFIPADARATIHAALDDNPHVTIQEYAGVDHGFATTAGKRRNDAAATLADGRSRAFFAEHLA